MGLTKDCQRRPNVRYWVENQGEVRRRNQERKRGMGVCLIKTQTRRTENIGVLQSLYFFKIICLFVYFWLRWVFVAARGFSLVVASRGYSSLQRTGFSLRWLLLLWSMGSRHAGFSCCGTRAQQLWLTGSRAQAQQLWHMGLVAPWHVRSSRTRARTRVPCIGRRILSHCATREVLQSLHSSH